MKEGYNVTCLKTIFFADIFESQYLFEIYRTSLFNIKNGASVVKSGCFERPILFEIKERHKVSCVKNISILGTYSGVSICLKYCTSRLSENW